MALGSKTVGKGLRDGADALDDQERHNNTGPWLAQHCSWDRTDWKRNTQRKKQRDSCLVPRVHRGACSNVCASITVRHPCSAGFSSSTKGAAHALEFRSAVMENGLTLKVVCVCETDASAGRAMTTRRGVGRVRHLDARLLWLQQLCTEGVVEIRARPGEHNEADL